MKRTRMQTFLMISLLLAVGMIAVAATPTAEKQYATIQAQDLSSQSLDDLMKNYDKLNEAVVREAQEAREAASEARSKGDRTAYYEALDILDRLSSYGIDEKTSTYMLQTLLKQDDEAKEKAASWLFRNSPYYRPTLTLDFSSEGENYRYSYRQQIRKEPKSEVILPTAGQLRLNSEQLGVLAGWGLTPDEVVYQPGETIEMSYTNQTLYAIYERGVRFVDALSGTDLFLEEGEGTVPTPATDDVSAIFAGWYDRSTRTLITDPTSYKLEGKGAYFEALWKRLAIEDFTVLYYDKDALPTNTQIGIGFSYSNTGTVDLAGLQATLSCDSDYVRMLDDSVFLGRLDSGLSSTNNSRWATEEKQMVQGETNTFRFIVSADAPSQAVLPFTLTITNDKGDSWTQSFECVVR